MNITEQFPLIKALFLKNKDTILMKIETNDDAIENFELTINIYNTVDDLIEKADYYCY